MRVFLAGASGVIGQRLVPRLVQAGHVVGGMTRSPNKTELLSRLGAEPILCDVFDREALIRAVRDFKPDVVLDELTDLPDDAARISERADLNARIRTEGTRNLIEAARRSGSPKILAQSVAWRLPDGPDARAVAELERSVLAEGGVVLRYGQFYGPGTYNEQQPPKEPRVQIDRAAERTVEALDEPTSVVVITDTQEGQKSSPADLVKALHSAFGNHHARAVHSKGIILEGFFTPSKEAASLTKAVHLQDATSQVVVRFSDFTGIPDIPDTNPLSRPRGMAIKFKLPNDASTDLVTHSFNGFPTATSDQFRELLLAIAASGPDAPKPTALDKFLETHPVARTFLTTQKPASVSYATLSYFGVNAFELTNQEGKTCLIRYQIIPEAGEEFLSKEQLANAAPDYLQKEIVGRVAKGPLKFKMQAQIAREGDDPKNPSVAWPDNRRVVALGTITIDKLASNTVVEDKALAFIPNDLPAGITPADPMIDFRSKAYPISVAERQ